MQRRLMSDGTVISRAAVPGGGHVYYVDGGPEGMVIALDTHMIPLAVAMACIAWETDIEPLGGPEPHCEFNKLGFRF